MCSLQKLPLWNLLFQCRFRLSRRSHSFCLFEFIFTDSACAQRESHCFFLVHTSFLRMANTSPGGGGVAQGCDISGLCQRMKEVWHSCRSPEAVPPGRDGERSQHSLPAKDERNSECFQGWLFFQTSLKTIMLHVPLKAYT